MLSLLGHFTQRIRWLVHQGKHIIQTQKYKQETILVVFFISFCLQTWQFYMIFSLSSVKACSLVLILFSFLIFFNWMYLSVSNVYSDDGLVSIQLTSTDYKILLRNPLMLHGFLKDCGELPLCLSLELLVIGPSGVRALPLGVAAEWSVHYIWYYFSLFFLCHILFSQKGLS